jgi:predicted  nucleic acid-binding Zn-ribbon protein
MEKIIIELEVKTKESSEAVKKLNKTFTEANKSTRNLTEELLEQKEILLLLERELFYFFNGF